MPHTDLILLRAPSIYDLHDLTLLKPPGFNERLNSVDPYLCDFLPVLDELEKAGHRVRVIDLPRRLSSKRSNLDAFIAKLDAPLFIIEVARAENLPGALDIAAKIKKSPAAPRVILFGLTAESFKNELIAASPVDGISSGPLDALLTEQLIDADTAAKSGKIPGLLWKEKRGIVRQNDPTGDLPSRELDLTGYYRGAFNHIKRQGDFSGLRLIGEYLKNPRVSIYKNTSHKSTLAVNALAPPHSKSGVFRKAVDVFHDSRELSRHTPAPILVSGDIRQPEGRFAEIFLSLLQHEPIHNKLIFELNGPASGFFIQEIARAAPGFKLQIAPGSHDEDIRIRLGHSYSNQEIESTIGDALRARAGGIELIFMTGLPGQNLASVEETVAYCETLLRRFDGDRRLSISLSPFSSLTGEGGFGVLKKLGFKTRFKSFEEYLSALVLPGWQCRQQYGTAKMTTRQTAEATYTALMRLERLKSKYGQIPYKRAETAAENYARGLQMADWLDGLAQQTHEKELVSFAEEIEAINRFETKSSRSGLPVFSRPRNPVAMWKALRGRTT